MNVVRNTAMSDCFTTQNGVKQGGVLSPLLFAVYIDELLCKLKQSGYGCTTVVHLVMQMIFHLPHQPAMA